MTPKAYIQHHLPGRLRLRVPERKGDPQWFAEVRDDLSELEAVRSVRVSPLTGGVLIEHRGGTLGSLVEQITGRKLFDLSVPETAEAEVSPSADPDRMLAGLSLERRHLAGIAFLVLAVHQALQGNILAPASSLAYHAFDLLSGDTQGP